MVAHSQSCDIHRCAWKGAHYVSMSLHPALSVSDVLNHTVIVTHSKMAANVHVPSQRVKPKRKLRSAITMLCPVGRGG